MVLFIPMALAPNVYALIFSRLVQGTCACIEGPTAAGGKDLPFSPSAGTRMLILKNLEIAVVADLFPKLNRGIPMGFFVLTGESLMYSRYQ